jgi:hypothetical protein
MSSRTAPFALAFAAMGLLLAASGCNATGDRAAYELRGATAQLMPNLVAYGADLAPYQDVHFRPATTELSSSLCPPSVLMAYDRQAREQRAGLRDAFPGGLPVLFVDTEIVHYQAQDPQSGAQLLARVKMRSQGRLLIDVIVNARSDSLRGGVAKDLARAAVDAVVRFLREQKLAADARAG